MGMFGIFVLFICYFVLFITFYYNNTQSVEIPRNTCWNEMHLEIVSKQNKMKLINEIDWLLLTLIQKKSISFSHCSLFNSFMWINQPNLLNYGNWLILTRFQILQKEKQLHLLWILSLSFIFCCLLSLLGGILQM